jgi:hypothetical protein
MRHFEILFYFYFFIIVLGGGTLEYLQKFLQCIKYVIFEFTPSATLLSHLTSSPLPQFPEQSQQVSFLHLLNMCLHYLLNCVIVFQY